MLFVKIGLDRQGWPEFLSLVRAESSLPECQPLIRIMSFERLKLGPIERALPYSFIKQLIIIRNKK